MFCGIELSACNLLWHGPCECNSRRSSRKRWLFLSSPLDGLACRSKPGHPRLVHRHRRPSCASGACRSWCTVSRCEDRRRTPAKGADVGPKALASVGGPVYLQSCRDRFHPTFHACKLLSLSRCIPDPGVRCRLARGYVCICPDEKRSGGVLKFLCVPDLNAYGRRCRTLSNTSAIEYRCCTRYHRCASPVWFLFGFGRPDLVGIWYRPCHRLLRVR